MPAEEELLAGFARVRGQAQGRHLPSAVCIAEGRHKACPYLSLSGRGCSMFGGRDFAMYSVADREREGL